MKKYLIFDLDGTLVRSNKQIDTIIYAYISQEIDPELLDKARYIIQNNQWMSLYETLEILLEWDKKTANIHADKIYDKINSISNEVDFFEWIPEKIIELSKKYRIFLSTGNSDEFAQKILKKWGIYDCFEKIYGSTYIPKSPEHVQQIINHIQDEDFVKKSIFIWDGQRDELIAKYFWMDFIHISPIQEKHYQIQSVNEINNILDIYSK